MIAVRRIPIIGVGQNVRSKFAFAVSQTAQYGRTAVYRRLSSQTSARSQLSSTSSIAFLQSSDFAFQRLTLSPIASSLATSRTIKARSLHISAPRLQQAQPKEDVKDPPREANEESKKAEEGEKQSSEEKSEGEESKKEKGDAAPPPPHGDKTPWQVFTETLRTEFKASKEWNDSTKQLAGSVQEFTESEGVRRAREASEAASKTTSKFIKGTGRAIGHGAAWTWDTKVVQGIRGGVNATGRGIERATRPVRETQTFKDISEAVDDGSSSRYGGWIEKEERRKRREARDLKEARSGKKPFEKMEEDPK